MDELAKRAIRELHPDRLPKLRSFPLEPLVITAGGCKITTDSGPRVCFWAHRKLARAVFQKRGILDTRAFDKVNWETFYKALHRVPRLFQGWACKQISNIAATNRYRSKFTPGLTPKCPSCTTEDETCGHVLLCTKAGRVDNLMRSISLLDAWLVDHNTEPHLRACLTEYARSRGEELLSDEDRYLLEINVEDLYASSGEAQECWVLAIQAARRVTQLRNEDAEGIG